ncbi:putative reverse transcriptase domain-containing protein [Tanacetum coccineum]
MDKAHKTRYSVHPRADKMYYDLRDMYWWSGMKKEIAILVARFDMCKGEGGASKTVTKFGAFFVNTRKIIGMDVLHQGFGKRCKKALGTRLDMSTAYHPQTNGPNKTLRFAEEPLEIMDREVKTLKRSNIPIMKVRWNFERGPEFTWEHKDHMKAKYP